jgi:[acyl-carrier-protein] S-malonyltransferase
VKRTAVVVAPGRGTYNSAELGYLKRHHGDKAAMLAEFDAFRQARGQETVTALDSAPRFSAARHTRGDNASPLIYAAAYADFLSIDCDRHDIVAVTGNSMGWYIALACAEALDAMGGLEVANTMGTLMQERLIGGQLVYPMTDDNWRSVPGRRAEIEAKMADIDARPDRALALSIDLGGMLVLAGNDAGLAVFEAEMPKVDDRFPMRLKNHAAFHTALQKPVATEGRARLGPELFRQPALPLIDGRGGIWHPKSSDVAALRDYTLGHQVTKPYDFATAIATAAREFMPDVFIVLGPGTTLGGSVAQSFIRASWRGWDSKTAFQDANSDETRLISMGMGTQRRLVA